MDADVPKRAAGGRMSDGEERFLIADLLRRHPALLLSTLYVVASTIGMLFSWDYLRRFGINVFNYAQIGDFLLASLKEPMTWGLVVLSVLLVSADNMMSRRWQKKERTVWTRWYGSRGYRAVNYLVALFMVIIFIHLYVVFKARDTYEGKGPMVEVDTGDTRRTATLLGTTAQFVFLFDAKTQRVYIHPNEAIQEIVLMAPGDDKAQLQR